MGRDAYISNHNCKLSVRQRGTKCAVVQWSNYRLPKYINHCFQQTVAEPMQLCNYYSNVCRLCAVVGLSVDHSY